MRVATTLVPDGSTQPKVLMAAAVGASALTGRYARTRLAYEVLDGDGRRYGETEEVDAVTPLYTVALRLRPGRYRVKVAAKDAEGRIGSVEHPFEVTAPPAEGIHVGGALLFRDTGEASAPVLLVDVPEGERAIGVHVFVRGSQAAAMDGIGANVEVTHLDEQVSRFNGPMADHVRQGGHRLRARRQLLHGALAGRPLSRRRGRAQGRLADRARRAHVRRRRRRRRRGARDHDHDDDHGQPRGAALGGARVGAVPRDRLRRQLRDARRVDGLRGALRPGHRRQPADRSRRGPGLARAAGGVAQADAGRRRAPPDRGRDADGEVGRRLPRALPRRGRGRRPAGQGSRHPRHAAVHVRRRAVDGDAAQDHRGRRAPQPRQRPPHGQHPDDGAARAPSEARRPVRLRAGRERAHRRRRHDGGAVQREADADLHPHRPRRRRVLERAPVGGGRRQRAPVGASTSRSARAASASASK